MSPLETISGIDNFSISTGLAAFFRFSFKNYTMKKLFLFLSFITFILSCNKEDDYKYLDSIKSGQISGTGIRYVDIVPDKEIAKYHNHYGDTITTLDLNNDGIDDFELRQFYEHYMYSSASGYLKIVPLGMNSVCVTKAGNHWIDSLKYNEIISSNNNWSDSTALLYAWDMHQITVPEFEIITDVEGYWYKNDSIYIGIRIVKDNNQLYGWIDMKGNVLRQYAVTVPYLE
jgi:hypothetical protein